VPESLTDEVSIIAVCAEKFADELEKADFTVSENIYRYALDASNAPIVRNAKVEVNQETGLTKDDIEVIQQLAMWYFANYDEQKRNIDPTVSQAIMYPAQFLSIDGNNNIDDERANNLDRIYQYFIKGAIENSNKYITDNSTGTINKRIEKNEFEKQTMTKTSHDDFGLYNYYEIGPVQIKGNAGERKTVKASDIKLYDAQNNIITNNNVSVTAEEDTKPRIEFYHTYVYNGQVARQAKIDDITKFQ